MRPSVGWATRWRNSTKKLASGLAKPYSVDTPYVNKSTHELEYFRRSFTYVPVRVPGTMRRLWLVVVKGRKEDWYLLCNEEEMNAERASQIVLAYLLRWGNEEVTRCFKQCTGAEKFRVRKLVAIRRLLFLAMLALATQALLLFLEPREAKRMMARVQAFIRTSPFRTTASGMGWRSCSRRQRNGVGRPPSPRVTQTS